MNGNFCVKCIHILYIYESMLITFFLKVSEVIILNSDLLLEIIRITNYFYFCFNGFVLKYHLQAINVRWVSSLQR